MKDATECIMIEYDPQVISFRDLIVAWGAMHNPRTERSRQYRSALFYGNDEQRLVVEDALVEMQKQLGNVFVDVEPWTRFYKVGNVELHFKIPCRALIIWSSRRIETNYLKLSTTDK